jgi:hypothetical protein
VVALLTLNPATIPARATVFQEPTTVPVINLIHTATSIVISMLPADISVPPNDTGLPGIQALRTIVGAIMTVALILSVLALLIAAIVWGFGAHSSNPHLAGRGKTGVLVACGAAALCGGAVTFINFFWNVGQGV